MRDPATIYTKKGTPLLLVISRVVMAVYLVFGMYSIRYNLFPGSTMNYVWLSYLILIFLGAEYIYKTFKKRGIDLSFAFPLLMAIYILNQTSMQLGGQEQRFLLNRMEHFTSFILLAYIVWVFFLKYLPQDVWKKHPFYTGVLTFCVTAAFGVGNEIIELFLDLFFNTRFIGTRLDTPLDLLMNTLGATLFLSVRLLVGKHKARISS